MKRIFLLAAALCCISLYSCDNEQDLDNLSPIELEILELDNLIASQSGFDEEALLADLNRGTMKMDSFYMKYNGKFEDLDLCGGSCPGVRTVFFNDGTCRDCFSYVPLEDGIPSGITSYSYDKYDWQYDSDTQSIITWGPYYNYLDQYEGSAKVLYYNAESHRLILEGHMFTFDQYITRMSGYIDVDPAERERIIEKYCGE